MDVTVTISGTITTFDKRAGILAITIENSKRQRIADVINGTPPIPDPLIIPDILPTSTNQELKTSYEEVLAINTIIIHNENIEIAAEQNLEEQDIRELWQAATDTQRDAAIAALQ